MADVTFDLANNDATIHHEQANGGGLRKLKLPMPLRQEDGLLVSAEYLGDESFYPTYGVRDWRH